MNPARENLKRACVQLDSTCIILRAFALKLRALRGTDG